MKVCSFVLDTLQIFFPWDDDFYTYLKQRGFASRDGYKALPLIYNDDCESTTGKHEIPRNYIIDPEKFSMTPEQLGWTRTQDKGKRYIIPAEKAVLEADLSGSGELAFKIVSNAGGREQYHLEYSVMSAFGKGYANWSVFYFKKPEFESFIAILKERGVAPSHGAMETGFESKQQQREELTYAALPVREYCFNMGAFKLAESYLRNAGYSDPIPSLVYDSHKPEHTKVMEPIIKFGILKTGDQGFWKRPPQVVMKISQSKYVTTGGRKRRIKGLIDHKKTGNYFVVNAAELMTAWEKVLLLNGSRIQAKLI